MRRVAAGVVTTFAGTGVQGFGGDGGPATAAVMDSPGSVAVASDGRVLIADARDNRVRVVGTDGVIATFAGGDVAGFGGDGGPATSAALFAPAGVTVTPSGVVCIADSGNHRVRMVGASGVVTTLVGNGVQGAATNAGQATSNVIDTPVSVAVSSAGDVVFADAGSATVMEVAADGTLRSVGVGSVAVSTSLSEVGPLVYGSGSVTLSLMAAGSAAEGIVALLDGGQVVSTGSLNAGSAMLSTALLAAGTHRLSASYAGDLLHGAAVSPVVAATGLSGRWRYTATAAGATVPTSVRGAAAVADGDAARACCRGIPARCRGRSRVMRVDLSPVGTYPISATLTGAQSANYMVGLSRELGRVADGAGAAGGYACRRKGAPPDCRFC